VRDWLTVNLGDVAEVFNGKTPAKSDQRDDGFPVLKIRDVDEYGQFRGECESFVDLAFADKYRSKWIKINDIMILT
jgi:type I restriction enzyme S subunit